MGICSMAFILVGCEVGSANCVLGKGIEKASSCSAQVVSFCACWYECFASLLAAKAGTRCTMRV